MMHATPFLIAACFVAGVVDSIGGGGGLISVPALLNANVPHAFVLGTNKSISSVGSSVSVFRYARAGLLPALEGRSWICLIVTAILGGGFGAALSQTSLILSHFDFIIPVLLLSVMAFLVWKWFFRKPVSPGDPKHAPLRPSNTVPSIGLVAGYDGIFGPGTGTLFLSYFEKRGFPTVEANAITKVFNLSSNAGALLFFASSGAVLWQVGFACAGAIMLGNFVGSTLVLRRGQGVVRVTVLLVTTAMLVRYFVMRG